MLCRSKAMTSGDTRSSWETTWFSAVWAIVTNMRRLKLRKWIILRCLTSQVMLCAFHQFKFRIWIGLLQIMEMEQMALTRAAEKIKACLLLTVTKYWTWMSRAWSFSHQTFLIRIVTNLTQLRPMLRHLSQEMSFHRSTATQPQHPTLQASTRHFICTSDYLLASVYASIRVHSSVEMTQSTRRKNTKMWLIRRTQMPLKKTPIVMKMTRKTQKIRDKKNLIRTRNSKLKSWTSSFLKKSWLPCKSLAQTCGHKTSKPATKCLKTHNQEEKVTKVKWMISNQVSRLA